MESCVLRHTITCDLSQVFIHPPLYQELRLNALSCRCAGGEAACSQRVQ
jgi:hypothetical protein